MKKKFFALLLCFCMVISLFSVNMTFATASDETIGQEEDKATVEIVDDVNSEKQCPVDSIDEEQYEEESIKDSDKSNSKVSSSEKENKPINDGKKDNKRNNPIGTTSKSSAGAKSPKLNNAVYDLTPEKDYIKIKINVIDWDTGEKVPGVSVGINRIGTCPGGPVNQMMTATSDANGVAYIKRMYQVDTPNDGSMNKCMYLDCNVFNQQKILYDSRPAYNGTNGIRFDIGPLTPGYSLDVSKSGKIRNCISSMYCGPVPLTVGANGPKYDDFIFHSGAVENGASIEYDLYVKSDKVTVSYENNNVKDWNASDYPSSTVKAGSVVTKPTKKPVNSENEEIEFKGWADKSTGELFDFSKPVNSSVTLIPKWGPNPNAQGYIHLDSFLWDHDGYNGTYQTGQTDTTVNDLTYVVEYYDQAVAVTSNWHTLTTVSVDENGKADFVLTPDMIKELSDFNDSIKNLPPVNGEPHRVAIDIGPSNSDKGWHEGNHRPLNYAWDWVKYNYEWFHGAGLTGVRMMWVNAEENPHYDLDRTNNAWSIGKAGGTETPIVGNVMYASNMNHVPWLTQGMLDDGFEIYWKCYVAPAMTVNFDLDGGTGTGNYTEQMMKPINSLPEQREDFLVKHPGGTVTKEGKIFVGWYKVNEDGSLETSPWDFANRIVTESMVLKAVYTDKLYTVEFKTPENGTQSRSHKVGDTPAWVGADPTKKAEGGYAYEFTGWKETLGTHLDAEYDFHEQYDFDHQSRTIYGKEATDPVTLDNTFADKTVYTAQFNAIPIEYTLKYNLDGGTGTFDDQKYTVETGVTIHNAEPSKTGYKFTGWKLETTDGNWQNKGYSKNETVTGKYGNTTLIAQYAPLYKYKLNFNKNTTDTVSNMPENIPETEWIEDSNKAMTWSTEPTREDYTFIGWSTSADGTVVIPAGTKSYTMDGSPAQVKEQTLYAIWQVNERPYTVKYLEQGTEKVLHEPKNSTGKIGETVYEKAETITGYELVSTTPQSLTLSTNEEDNVIVFYYKENEVTINYVAVTEDGGSVNPASETVKVLNGTASGSTAIANPGYVFKGWYSDEACTKKIADTEKYIPGKNNTSGMYEAATYYAKFEEKVGTLTVEKSGAESVDENQSFIFHVFSTELEDKKHDPIDMYVTVQGNGTVSIKDLPIGEYKVEEDQNWSWRYKANSENIILDADGESVTINNTRNDGKWLSGSAYAINTKNGRQK